MSTHPFLAALSLFTLVAVLGYGIWQYSSVRGSQKQRGEPTGTLSHEHFSADDDLSAPHAVETEEAKPPPVRLPEPIGAANTRSAEPPPPGASDRVAG